MFPLPVFTKPYELSPILYVASVLVTVCPLPVVNTAVAFASPTVIFGVVLLPPIFTAPPCEYIPIPLFPAVISPVVSSSYPYIPIPVSPTVIFPVFVNGFVPVELASVYIPTPFAPRLIVSEFKVVYCTELASFDANIPVPFDAVLIIFPAFSKVVADVKLGL